ncbi:hypothetical protein AIOL_004610 [Candidatus Rhodobacter oscarellae]|uniref:Uncharacterized protein n=1 Tax=Candidatus Rhodobacter oscarellae TaxID=1675527 RepID=A0A0J9H1N3_9RHOB|nr:hypothetical protein AIOL_004610 [Candidatus Rhodobacter lobularis]
MWSDPFHALVKRPKWKAQELGRLNACTRKTRFVNIAASIS